MLDEGHYTSLK